MNAMTKRIAIRSGFHLYDIRNSEYCGYVKKVSSEILPGRGKVYALSPYRVKGIKLNLNQNVYKQGDTLSYKIAVKASADNLSNHVFRLELIDPQNKLVKYYNFNLLAKKGICSGNAFLCLNEQKGKWRIKAKDILSGKTAEKEFFVQ